MKKDNLRKPYEGWFDFENLCILHVPIHKFWDEKPKNNDMVLAIAVSFDDPFDKEFENIELYDQCFESVSGFFMDVFAGDEIDYNEKGMVWMFWVDIFDIEEMIKAQVKFEHLQGIAVRQVFREVMIKHKEEIARLKENEIREISRDKVEETFND